MDNYSVKIQEIIEPVVEAQGMEIIQVECLRMKSRWLVRLYLDKENGSVSVDDCARISDLVGDILDVHDIPPGSYILEVSSPGVNRPLVRDKDFVRYQGQRVHVQTHVPVEGIRNFHGELVAYLDEPEGKILLVQVKDRAYRIPRSLVVKAHLEVVV
ncbi:MAG: ribosome maturation factor RimP [Syntrophales bacterium]|nr:ribosome maturation factor RimP [Syntrophales bacterium]